MCGIVGYIGHNKNIRIGLEALKRLEYRGYDSAGMVVYEPEKQTIFALKAVGKIQNLEQKLSGSKIKGSPFIFYTRWATHGGVTEQNCHPHADCKNNIWVAHNGIIENYRQLKEKLIGEGHIFRSETDTEVVPHLIEKFFKGNLEVAVQRAITLLKGSFALVILAKEDPDKLIAVRNSAPLLIGLLENEYIAASDPSAVITLTKKVIYLDDGDMAVLTPNKFSIRDIHRNRISKPVTEIDWNLEDSQKGGYPHFMLKEIMEQPEAIENALRGRIFLKEGTAKLGGVESMQKRLRNISHVQIIGCGTSYYAGVAGEYMLEEYAGIPTDVDIASEFRYRKPVINPSCAFVFISQSGETADTLAALREIKRKGGLTLGIVNVVGSSIAREIDVGIYNHAGPEIGVASTKAFTSQVAIVTLLTLFLGRQREMSLVTGKKIGRGLLDLPKLAKKVLEKKEHIKELAEKYQTYRNFLYIGRKYNYPIALEGALKLKEISYLHAEGYGAGEMKHGPIALIDENFPVIALCPSDSVYEKTFSNIQETKARKGPVFAIATEGNKEIATVADDVFYIPKTLEMITPILAVIPLQLFAYYMAVLKGHDPDKPRNLAKSVTVE